MNTARIGFLATGTEIVQGDIVNTNAATLAAELTQAGYNIGLHMMVSDDQADIEACLNHLLQTHDVILVIGGLGPTTDDRTRFAAANVVKQDLIFFQESWDRIVARFKQYGSTLTENNRQQAYFPANAQAIANPNGSADGCKIPFGNKVIYLMPGPPNECIPMFREAVLPDINHYIKPRAAFKKRWRLFGVSESQIAEKLEAILAGHPVSTGYRVDYPYLEFKIEGPEDFVGDTIVNHLLPLIQPHFLSDEYHPASELLKQQLAKLPFTILIIDKATAGLLQSTITTRQNRQHVTFAESLPQNAADFPVHIVLEGINEYWQSQDTVKQVEFTMAIRSPDEYWQESFTVPYRGVRTVRYVTEFACHKILEFLQK